MTRRALHFPLPTPHSPLLTPHGQFADFTRDMSDGGLIPDFANPRSFLLQSTELHGGPGSDLLTGGAEDDVLYGDEEADDISRGDPGRIDRIFGMEGDNIIFGGVGDDRIRGG